MANIDFDSDSEDQTCTSLAITEVVRQLECPEKLRIKANISLFYFKYHLLIELKHGLYIAVDTQSSKQAIAY